MSTVKPCTADSTPDRTLVLEPNLADPDGFYEELIGGQRDMNDEQAQLFQARLLLVLANHIGDRQVLSAAIRVARDSG